jgi:transposase-like protein
VYRVLRAAGFHGKRIDYGTLAPTVVRLYGTGENASSIAEQLGIEITAVYRTLQKAGRDRRSPSVAHCHSGIRHDYFQ